MGSLAFGQEDPSWEPVFRSINTEVQSHSKAYSTLGEATRAIGHRLTGSKNGAKAEEYAFKLLRSYGFKDVRYQPFEVESWSRTSLTLKVGNDPASLQPVKSVSLAHSPVSAGLRQELVDMGNGLEADYARNPDAVKGKIALVYLGLLPGSEPGTKSLHRSEKTAIAIKHGARGIVIINTVPGGVLLTGTASVTGKLIPIPAVCIALEDGMKLKEALKGSKQYADIQMKNKSGLIRARNVIATIPGQDLKAEKIVVGGHLDSWDLATGAIDNGIGSFSVLDMARTFQTLGLKSKRTIEFVMFMGEEEGLLGSKAYVNEAMKNNTLGSVRYMLNYDMTNDPKGYSSTQESDRELFTAIGALAAKIDTGFKNLFRSGAGLHSDHQPFMLRGVPTGGAAGGRLPNNSGGCYHADCDSYDLVDEQGMKNTVRYNSMLIYGLANAAEINAKQLTDEETKAFLIKNNLKEPLVIGEEWRWGD
ncbi:MAG TPA: M28 family peptidase, partial [Sphingobacteriaceae bacterium]